MSKHQSCSDDDSDDDWNVTEEWEGVDIEEALPGTYPEELGLPAFTDNPTCHEFPVNDYAFQRCHSRILNIILFSAYFIMFITPELSMNL